MKEEVERFVERALHEREARSVLDAGCGTGSYTQALGQAGFDAVGVDRIRWKIALARSCRVRASFVHGDFRALAHPGSDAVVCIGVLHSVLPPEARNYMAALVRLVKPSGVLVIIDIAAGVRRRHDPVSLAIRIDEFVAGLVSPGHQRAFSQYLAEGGLGMLLSEARLKRVSHTPLYGGALDGYVCCT